VICGRLLSTVIVVLLLAPLLAAQQPVTEPWRLSGSLGLGYSGTRQTPLFLTNPATSSASSYNTAQGDLRLDLGGYVKDPLLLPFSVNFDGVGGNNIVSAGSYTDTNISWGFNTIFLPASSFPLRAFFQQTQFDTGGTLFGQNSNTRNFGVDWAVRKNNLPHINLDFGQFSNDVKLATSVLDTNWKQKSLAFDVSDDWKGWDWSGNYGRYAIDSSLADFVSLPANSHENLQVVGAHLRKNFLDGKAHFALENRDQWEVQEFPSFGKANSSDSYTSATLGVDHTEKLSSSYYYNFVHVTTGQQLFAAPGVLPPGQFQLLTVPSFNSQSASARVNYRLTPHLRLSQQVRYQYSTPPSQQQESQQSLGESLSSVSYQNSWHSLEFNGTYTGHFQLLGTNFGNHTNTFSNDVYGRVAWGRVERVRLSLSGANSKLNLVQMLNGFSSDSRARAELETKPWRSILFRLYGEWSSVELLNIAGDTKQDSTGFGFQIEHRLFALSASDLHQNGAGALFPSVVQAQFAISEPLPLNLLLGTPLLNRDTQIKAASAV
jgi:hypothetical protein